MQFDNIELRDLIRFVSNIMGKNFIYDETVVRGKATILSPRSLTKDEVYRVFESVLNYYGFTIVTTPEALKIVRSADAKGMAVETLDKQDFMERTPEEKITTLVYPLEYLDSNTMVGILRPLMSRDAYLVSVPASNALIMIDTASNLQRLRGLIARVDLPVSRQLSSIEVYNVQHTNAADLAKTLQALLAEGKKAQTPKEKIFVTAYPATNSLLISAPPEDMKEIRRIVDEIDTFRPQVLVEAAIVELTLSRTQSLGVEWLTGGSVGGNRIIGGNLNTTSGGILPLTTGLLASTTTTAATGGAAAIGSAVSSGLNIGVFGQTITMGGVQFPSVQAFLKALATDGRSNVLSTPQLLTMNNEEAEVMVGRNVPYTTSIRVDAAGNPITNFDYRDVGVKLKVKPYINKDGLVHLNIFTEVTNVETNSVQVGQGIQQAPTTFKRSTKTTVGVKDAQTIVISGLIQDNRSANDQGIPGLRAIPLFGSLFGSKQKSSEKTNLLVFLTPRIVYAAEILDKLTDEKKGQQKDLLFPEGKE
jgi:general secretion pathway protein D